jgi:hypothetical protein
MNSYLLSQGLLMESDRVSLSSQLIVKTGTLWDLATNAKHRLAAPADELIHELANRPTFVEWHQRAKVLGVSDSQFTNLIAGLHDIGGLQIRRDLRARGQWWVTAISSLCFGLRPRVAVHARPASWTAIAGGVWGAMSSLLSSAPLIGLLLYGLGFSLGTVILMVGVALFELWFSTVVHELSHWLVLGEAGRRAVFIRRGLRLGLLHAPVSRSREITSALVGPLAGAVACLLIGGTLTKMPEFLYGWFVTLSCASFHALSLAPFYSDGESVWKCLRRRHEKTS